MIWDGFRILVGIRVNIRIPVKIPTSSTILVRVRTNVILVRIQAGIGIPVRIEPTSPD